MSSNQQKAISFGELSQPHSHASSAFKSSCRWHTCGQCLQPMDAKRTQKPAVFRRLRIWAIPRAEFAIPGTDPLVRFLRKGYTLAMHSPTKPRDALVVVYFSLSYTTSTMQVAHQYTLKFTQSGLTGDIKLRARGPWAVFTHILSEGKTMFITTASETITYPSAPPPPSPTSE